jgi:predicted metal-binding membrane protein
MVTATTRSRRAHAPETWIYGVAAAAAAALVIHHLSGFTAHEVAGAGHQHGGHHMPDMSPVAPAAPPGLATAWLWWMVMAVAMMLPVAAPSARRIARAGLWRRRHIAIAEFLLGYLGVWAVIGLPAIAVVAAVWPAGAPILAVPATLVVAAIWQVNPVRKRALRKCRGSAFVHVRGWRTDRDCLGEGVKSGLRCVGTCGPVMAAMAVGHSLVVMLIVTALLLSERARGPNPAQRAGRPFEAICLVILAGVAFTWAAATETALP